MDGGDGNGNQKAKNLDPSTEKLRVYIPGKKNKKQKCYWNVPANRLLHRFKIDMDFQKDLFEEKPGSRWNRFGQWRPDDRTRWADDGKQPGWLWGEVDGKVRVNKQGNWLAFDGVHHRVAAYEVNLDGPQRVKKLHTIDIRDKDANGDANHQMCHVSHFITVPGKAWGKWRRNKDTAPKAQQWREAFLEESQNWYKDTEKTWYSRERSGKDFTLMNWTFHDKDESAFPGLARVFNPAFRYADRDKNPLGDNQHWVSAYDFDAKKPADANKFRDGEAVVVLYPGCKQAEAGWIEFGDKGGRVDDGEGEAEAED